VEDSAAGSQSLATPLHLSNVEHIPKTLINLGFGRLAKEECDQEFTTMV
jgi:hypothetical protein